MEGIGCAWHAGGERGWILAKDNGVVSYPSRIRIPKVREEGANMSFEHIKHKEIKEYKLAKEIGRVPSSVVELDPEQEARAKELQQNSIVIDFHSHPVLMPEDMSQFVDYSRRGRYHTGYEGLKKAGLTACLDGMGSLAYMSAMAGWQFEDMVFELGMRFSDFDHHRDEVIIGRFAEDIGRAKKEGKVAIIPHIENAGAIGNYLDRIDVLYGLGYRCMGLTYNDSNWIGGGRTEKGKTGLSHFGRDVVGRMNDLGVLIDLAHSNDAAILEAVEVSEAPCVTTHDCAYSVNQSPRCKGDQILKAIADKGGVIGVEAVPNVLSTKPKQGIEDVLDHMEHMVKVAGIDHVAMGLDTLFGDHVGLHKEIMVFIDLSKMLREFPTEYMDGIENPSEIPNVTRGLVKRGYSDEEIKKLIGSNVLRIFEEVVG